MAICHFTSLVHNEAIVGPAMKTNLSLLLLIIVVGAIFSVAILFLSNVTFSITSKLCKEFNLQTCQVEK